MNVNWDFKTFAILLDVSPFTGGSVWIFYFEKIRVFKAGSNAVNTLAWNNEIGLWFPERSFYFVGLWDRSND